LEIVLYQTQPQTTRYLLFMGRGAATLPSRNQ
jgi:hypothetical protein